MDNFYGRWQGLTPDEAGARWPEEVTTWYHTPHAATIPGGETLDGVRTRAMEAVNELAARHRGQTTVLVGHVVVNRTILQGVLGLRIAYFWQLRQGTCALNVFEVEGDGFALVTMNDTCHLRPGGAGRAHLSIRNQGFPSGEQDLAIGAS